MCTKIPYPNRWIAARAVLKLRASGRSERAVHPCFTDHPGCWHVTSKKAKKRWASASTQSGLDRGAITP